MIPFKITEYPTFDNPRNNTPEQELELLRKIIWLSSKQFVAFGSYNGKTWDEGAYPFLIANDTFYYACADGEEFEEKDIDSIIGSAYVFGWDGIAAWMSIKRNQEVIPELINDTYKLAKEHLQGNVLIDLDPPLNFDLRVPVGLDKIALLYRLIWLCSRDMLSFSTPEEWGDNGKTGIHCFDNIYAFSTHTSLSEKDIELLIDLYNRFNYHGFDAWQVVIDKDWRSFVESIDKPVTQEYLAAIDYLERLNK